MSDTDSDDFADPASTSRTVEASRQASAYSSAWGEEEHREADVAQPEAAAAGHRSPTTASVGTPAAAAAADAAPAAPTAARAPRTPTSAQLESAAAAAAAAIAAMALEAAAPGGGGARGATGGDGADGAAAPPAAEPAPLLEQAAAAAAPGLPPTAARAAQQQQRAPGAAARPEERWRAAHVRSSSNISFGSLASDSQLQTLGAASDDGAASDGGAASSGGSDGSSSGSGDEASPPAPDAGAGSIGEESAAAAAAAAAAGGEGGPGHGPNGGAERAGASGMPWAGEQQQQAEAEQGQGRLGVTAAEAAAASSGSGELEAAARGGGVGGGGGGAMSPTSRLELRRLSSGSPEQDEDSAWGCWSRRRRHFFVVTAAGKPVYSRHGDEAALAGFLAVIQAIASVVSDQGDGVRSITSGPLNIVFLARGHLYLVAASSRAEPHAALRAQLHLLHQHVLLLVTGGIERALTRNPGYDVRNLLGASSACLSALLSSVGDDPFWAMGGVEPAPLAPQERRAAAAALAGAVKASGALFGVISAGRRPVAVEASGRPMAAPDARLLLNFLASNEALRSGEAFVPVCLPGFNPTAYLQAYVACLDADAGVFLALLAGGGDALQNLAGQRGPVEAALQQSGALRRLSEAASAAGGGRLPIEAVPPAAGGGVPGAAALWHFAAWFPGRRQGVQAAHAAHVFPDRRARKELCRAYVRAYCTLHAQQLAGGASGSSSSTSSGGAAAGAAGAAAAAAAYVLSGAGAPPGGGRPARLLWVATPRWVLLAAADRELEVFCCFDPLTPQEGAARAAEALRRWLAERGRGDALLMPPLGA
ncbi:MAG: trafficking protein Mon1-domain-containing protein [Monoraphidium minutum]|nr:MAG: trafficking protein Mon1-domain-containing protein [Monoraphidium minutum]